MIKVNLPKKNFLHELNELKDAFDYQRRAMSSTWLWACLLHGVVVFFFLTLGLFVLLVLPVSSEALSRVLKSNIIIYSTVTGIIYFIIKVLETRYFRNKIIADMKTAVPMAGFVFGELHYNYGVYKNWASTMAGTLSFISDKPIYPNMIKKAGMIYEYFEFPKIEGLNQKELRYFISGWDRNVGANS